MKFKFSSLTIFFGSAVISVLSLATIYELAQAAPSSYQHTCDSERIKGNYLMAFCKTGLGGIERSSILLRGIYNINGKLVQNILRSDISFRLSCRDISINNGTLSASCLNENQERVETSIVLEEITNKDGNLVYEFEAYINETARKISLGHAYKKHADDFSTDNMTPAPSIFERIVKDVITRREEEKNLTNGRKAYWKTIDLSNYMGGRSIRKGTVVIVDPKTNDRGTAFVPREGKGYYDGLR